MSACSLGPSTRCTFAPWTAPLCIFAVSPPALCRGVVCTCPACTAPRSTFPRCTFTLCTLPLCLSARCTLPFGVPPVRHRRFRLTSENAPTIVAAVRTFLPLRRTPSSPSLRLRCSLRPPRAQRGWRPSRRRDLRARLAKPPAWAGRATECCPADAHPPARPRGVTDTSPSALLMFGAICTGARW